MFARVGSGSVLTVSKYHPVRISRYTYRHVDIHIDIDIDVDIHIDVDPFSVHRLL